MKLPYLCFVLFFLNILSADTASKAMILILDRTEADSTHTERSFEDLFIQELSHPNLQFISSELLTDSLSTSSGKAPQDYETQFKESSTAQQMARNYELDYVFIVTLSTYSKEAKEIKAYGNVIEQTEINLRGAWKLLETRDMSTETAGRFNVSKALQNNANLTVQVDQFLPELLELAADQIGEQFRSKHEQIAQLEPDTNPNTVAQFTVNTSIRDIAFPNFVLNKDGHYEASEYKVQLTSSALEIEVDGLVLGSSGATLKTSAGIHNLRISGEGIRPWQRMVNIRDGFSLSVDIQLTDEALARWQEQIAFTESIKDNKQLTDAEVERVKGLATMLRQSGFKVDTDEAPSITNEHKSLFSEAITD